MGSSSQSTTANTSINSTVQDNENPLVLSGSAAIGDRVINGANSGVVNALDGGVIKAAFDFSNNSVEALSAATIELIKGQQKTAADALSFGGTQTAQSLDYAKPEVAVQKDNRVLYAIIAGVVIGLWVWKRGKL